MPSVNLISNVGFGPGATHTTVVNGLACIGSQTMLSPLNHPVDLVADHAKDDYTFNVKSGHADKSANAGIRSIINLTFPLIGQWIRVARLLPRIPNAPLLFALARLHVWPDAKEYDRKTGRLY